MISIFPPDIWGTISDWFMVIITTITAYYLYHTLKAQKDVQQTQNELFNIERIRFRESIKPVLKYSGSTDKMTHDEKDKKILTIEVTNSTDCDALNISKIMTKGAHVQQVLIARGISDMQNHLSKGDAPMLFHFLVDSKNPISQWVIFVMTYEDIAGTKYNQRVVCICDEYGIEMSPSLPETIS